MFGFMEFSFVDVVSVFLRLVKLINVFVKFVKFEFFFNCVRRIR